MKRVYVLAAALALIAVAGGCMQANGREWSPAQAALTPSVQAVSQSADIYGLNLDLLGCEGHDYTGLGLGGVKFAHNMDGAHVAIWGLCSWNANGLQASGFLNNAAGEANGIQLAGIANGIPSLSRRLDRLADAGEFALEGVTLRGAQAALVYNCAKTVRGAQIGGIANIAQENVRGAQFACLFNKLGRKLGTQEIPGDVVGLQAAGIGNGGQVRVRGAQVAGLANSATEGISGLQLSLLVNQTRNLSGVQIGLLNFNKRGLLPFCPLINMGFGEDNPE